MSNGEEKNKDMEKDLNVISSYIEKQIHWTEIFLGAILLLPLLVIVVMCTFNKCCKQPDESNNLETKLNLIQTEIIKVKEDIKKCQSNNQNLTSQHNLEKNNQLKKSTQHVDVKFDFKAKVGGSSLNLSAKGNQKLDVRSDCFWFIILFVISLCLIILFYLISRSSRDSKFLQFVIEWNEQKKK